ncbi:MAG: heme NO-binding domain-containing protein [Mariniblastus sp.]|nr:heme NO-binding domain-containing protein [Mariniblastus sp.]
MKGVIFRSFYTHVQNSYGDELLEQLIEGANLPSGGAYTTVGTYDVDEMVSLVVGLSKTTGQEVPEVLKDFGRGLFGLLLDHYPAVVEHCQDSFTLISAIDSYIHVEVKKLYPDADLPSFQTEQTEPNQLWVRYRSVRGFADLAEGLFEGCFDHYGEDVDMLVEDCSGGAKTDVKFRFQRKGPARG